MELHIRRARRRIHDLLVRKATVTTTEALRRIAELYAIEERIRGPSQDQRRQIRQQQANFMLDQWQALLYLTARTGAPRSTTTSPKLRGVALGPRIYMFLGADSGGERAPAMYSLIVSAKLNGIDPLAYLRRVLTQFADYPINRAGELLPWNVAGRFARHTD